MSQIIKHNDEFIRINPKQATKIEFSKNDGRTWSTRYSSSSSGDFHALVSSGKEVVATTSKGLYFSRNDGRTWSKRS